MATNSGEVYSHTNPTQKYRRHIIANFDKSPSYTPIAERWNFQEGSAQGENEAKWWWWRVWCRPFSMLVVFIGNRDIGIYFLSPVAILYRPRISSLQKQVRRMNSSLQLAVLCSKCFSRRLVWEHTSSLFVAILGSSYWLMTPALCKNNERA